MHFESPFAAATQILKIYFVKRPLVANFYTLLDNFDYNEDYDWNRDKQNSKPPSFGLRKGIEKFHSLRRGTTGPSSLAPATQENIFEHVHN